jgi:hypothetical protein
MIRILFSHIHYRANSIYVELLGDESPEVAVSINNLAFILSHLGNTEKAQELLTQTGKREFNTSVQLRHVFSIPFFVSASTPFIV